MYVSFKYNSVTLILCARCSRGGKLEGMSANYCQTSMGQRNPINNRWIICNHAQPLTDQRFLETLELQLRRIHQRVC